MTGPACLLLALAATSPATTPAAAPAPTTTVAGSEAFPRKEVPPLVKDVFATGFAFCTDEHYPLTSDELKWCVLLAKEDARCPALARVCSRPATARAGRSARRSRGGCRRAPAPDSGRHPWE